MRGSGRVVNSIAALSIYSGLDHRDHPVSSAAAAASSWRAGGERQREGCGELEVRAEGPRQERWHHASGFALVSRRAKLVSSRGIDDRNRLPNHAGRTQVPARALPGKHACRILE
jgi:hypothetical protein